MPPGKHKSKLTANAHNTIKHIPIQLFLSRYLFPLPYPLDKDLASMAKPTYPIKNSLHRFPGSVYSC